MRNGLSRIVLKTTMLPIEIVRIMALRQSEGRKHCVAVLWNWQSARYYRTIRGKQGDAWRHCAPNIGEIKVKECIVYNSLESKKGTCVCNIKSKSCRLMIDAMKKIVFFDTNLTRISICIRPKLILKCRRIQKSARETIFW